MAMNELLLAEKAVQALLEKQALYIRHGSSIDLSEKIAAAKAAFELAETEQLEFMAFQEWNKGPVNPSEAQQNYHLSIPAGSTPPPRPQKPPAEFVADFVKQGRARWAAERHKERLKEERMM